VFEVEDIDADAWLAEVAVVAESRQAAFWKIRDAGLHKKQIHGDGRPVRTHHVLEFANAFDDRATARTTPRAGIVGNGGPPFRCAGPGPRERTRRAWRACSGVARCSASFTRCTNRRSCGCV
jgi:hypothetical protein